MKKGADDETVEELYGGADESDNEEIENMLNAAEPSLDEEEGEYNYDDLDRVANDDDDDLIGDASDAKAEPTDIEVEMDGEDEPDFNKDIIDVGDADEDSEGEDEKSDSSRSKWKRGKLGRKPSKSPFASLEDYEHLLVDDDGVDDGNEEDATKEKPRKKKKSKSQKKKHVSK